VAEQSDRLGGVAGRHGPGAPLVAWLVRECERLGVRVELGRRVTELPPGPAVVATGSIPGERSYEVAGEATVLDVTDPVPDSGAVVIWDPIGGPIGVALAEALGDRAVLVTQDQIAGNELSRTGDLAPANTRLAQRGVRLERRALLRVVRPGAVEVEDRFSGSRRTVPADVVVDAGFRLPDQSVADGSGAIRAGDCVAPRTIAEAIREGRAAAGGIR
jgi:hypothetical protein